MKTWLKTHWQMITILVVATFYRFYALSTNPPGLYPDEAANGLDVIGFLEQGKHAVIFGTNGPRESLFIYFQGLFVWIGNTLNIDLLNYTPLSLRIAPAIVGIATVWAVYLLAKELFNKNVGLFAAAAMALNPWHVLFSRLGFRAIMAPLALSLMFYFFIRAYRNGKLSDYIGTGIFLALGFYTYLSFRMVPLIFIALLTYILIVQRDFIQKNIKNILAMAGIFLFFMIPLFIHFYHVPGDIAGRSSTSIFNSELNNGSPAKTFIKNVTDTALMFNVKGDANFRHNYGSKPMLDPFLGILLLIGFAFSIFKIRKIENFLLLVWFVVMSLPALLTAEGMPHALRMVGTLPVVIIWCALGLDLVLQKIKIKYAATIGLVSILVLTGAYTFNRHFLDYPNTKEAREAYTEDMVEMAYDINRADSGRTNIIISGEFGTKTIQFITHSTGNKFEQYEVRDVEQKITLPENNYKIFVSKSWKDEAEEKLKNIGLQTDLIPVRSTVTGEIIYYEYEAK